MADERAQREEENVAWAQREEEQVAWAYFEKWASQLDEPYAEPPPPDHAQVFYVSCPLGSVCSCKGGILKKRPDWVSANKSMAWHLFKSPYHSLSAEESWSTSQTKPPER